MKITDVRIRKIAVELITQLLAAACFRERKRDIKDLGAAAVLVCAISAALVGIIIFLPKIIALCC